MFMSPNQIYCENLGLTNSQVPAAVTHLTSSLECGDVCGKTPLSVVGGFLVVVAGMYDFREYHQPSEIFYHVPSGSGACEGCSYVIGGLSLDVREDRHRFRGASRWRFRVTVRSWTA